MTAGDLRDRLQWFPPVRTDNGHGQAVVTYPTPRRATWAKVEATQAAAEADRHQQQTPLLSYEITIRREMLPDLAHDWEAVWVNRGGRRLAVTAVLPHPNGGEWQLVLARERAATTPA